MGASSTACRPASTTWSIARSATTVLPEPTSPCSSRLSGGGADSASDSSSPTFRCPAVSANGSRASNAAASPSSPRGHGGAGRTDAAILSPCSASCRPRASSHVSRRIAGSCRRRWPAGGCRAAPARGRRGGGAGGSPRAPGRPGRRAPRGSAARRRAAPRSARPSSPGSTASPAGASGLVVLVVPVPARPRACGVPSVQRPLNLSSFPANIARVPRGICRWRQGWLKKVTATRSTPTGSPST